MSLPPRRSFWRVEGLEFKAEGWGDPELVLARAQCRFGRFDLSRLPENKRASALSLQLQGWSPFSDSDGVVIWSGDGQASVWCWDRAALEQTWQAAANGAKLPRIVPETCLYPPASEGVRLLACLDGIEAQHWVAGQLRASRWWAAPPGTAELLAFQRDCGLALDQQRELLPLESPAMAQRPWAPLARLGGGSGQLAASEMLGYALLAVALALPALYLGVQQVRLSQARAAAQAELARETARTQGVASARNDALTRADQARALVELQPYPPPLVHMLAIARAMPDNAGVALKEWEQNEGKLRLLVVSATADIVGADHVQALEQTGLFTDVKILTQSDARQMAFTMNLKPQAALALPSTTASGPDR